jgi:prolyl 4-hydroxylase
MNLPIDHGEGLQVLRYGPGTRSTPHFDFLVPRNAAVNSRSAAADSESAASWRT